MNIIQIGSYLFPDLVGGAEISAMNISKLLQKEGHIIYSAARSNGSNIFTTRVTKDSTFRFLFENWRPYEPINPGAYWQKPIFYLQELFAGVDHASFRKLTTDARIGMILVHSFRGIGHNLLETLAKVDLPTVIFLHDYALVCLNKGRRRNGENCFGTCGLCKHISRRNRERLSRVSNLLFIGPSKYVCDVVRAELALTNARFLHIPNPNVYKISSRQRHCKTPLVFGYLGRLESDKGVGGMLECFLEVSREINVKLRLAGDGSLKSFVAETAQRIPAVEFSGYIDPTGVDAWLDKIDVLVMPSLWAENFPGTAVQSLMSGAPIITFDVGGIPEIVKHNYNGLVAKSGDFAAMKAFMKAFIDGDYPLDVFSANAIFSSTDYNHENLSRMLAEALSSFAASAAVGAAE